MDAPAPAEKEESELIVNDQEEDNDDDFPTIVAMNTVRAKCLQKLGYQLNWDNVDTVRLPVEWDVHDMTELDGVDVDECHGNEDVPCLALIKTFLAFFSVQEQGFTIVFDLMRYLQTKNKWKFLSSPCI